MAHICFQVYIVSNLSFLKNDKKMTIEETFLHRYIGAYSWRFLQRKKNTDIQNLVKLPGYRKIFFRIQYKTTQLRIFRLNVAAIS